MNTSNVLSAADLFIDPWKKLKFEMEWYKICSYLMNTCTWFFKIFFSEARLHFWNYWKLHRLKKIIISGNTVTDLLDLLLLERKGPFPPKVSVVKMFVTIKHWWGHVKKSIYLPNNKKLNPNRSYQYMIAHIVIWRTVYFCCKPQFYELHFFTSNMYWCFIFQLS